MTSLPGGYWPPPDPRSKRHIQWLWTVPLLAALLALVAVGASRVADRLAATSSTSSVSSASSPSWAPPGVRAPGTPRIESPSSTLLPAPSLGEPHTASPWWAPPGASAPSAATPPSHAPHSYPRPPRSPGTSSGLLDLSALAAKVDPGLVDINTQLSHPNAQAAGTGIVLDSSGVVLTNNHVISGATTINVTDIGNGETYPATVIGYDGAHDVAVLQLQGASGLPAAVIGNSSTVEIGDRVAAIGNAGGRGGTPSIVAGTVSALNQSATVADEITGGVERLAGLIEFAGDIQPGDSGGPLVNAAGEVIGVNTAGAAGTRSAPGGDGLAIPIDDALAISTQIRAGNPSATSHIGATGVLGILVQDTGAPGRHARLPYRHHGAVPGAAVTGIVPGSPAEQAGLVAGDVIVSLDGTAIDSPSTLVSVLTAHHPGDSVQVVWVDPAGQQHTVTVVLAPGPPN